MPNTSNLINAVASRLGSNTTDGKHVSYQRIDHGISCQIIYRKENGNAYLFVGWVFDLNPPYESINGARGDVVEYYVQKCNSPRKLYRHNTRCNSYVGFLFPVPTSPLEPFFDEVSQAANWVYQNVPIPAIQEINGSRPSFYPSDDVRADVLAGQDLNLLVTCALRFDGAKYRSDHPNCSILLPDYYHVSGFPTLPEQLLLSFFTLQRSLRQQMQYSPRYDLLDWWYMRELFFRCCKLEIPTHYRKERNCLTWEQEFVPQLDQHILTVRRVHDLIIYRDHAGQAIKPESTFDFRLL